MAMAMTMTKIITRELCCAHPVNVYGTYPSLARCTANPERVDPESNPESRRDPVAKKDPFLAIANIIITAAASCQARKKNPAVR